MNTSRLTAKSLAAAAIFSIMACACSKEPAETPNENITTVHVNVSAGIDSSMVKSAVRENGTIRGLTFTAGDSLYVRAAIAGTDKILVGFLGIDGTPGSNVTNAVFEGDLTVYAPDKDKNYYSSYYSFSDSNPLLECTAVTHTSGSQEPMAVLVHRGTSSKFQIDYYSKRGYYGYGKTASTINDLMVSILKIGGNYDVVNKRFDLGVINEDDQCTAMLDVTVTGGLAANTEYSVYYLSGSTEDDANYSEILGTITSDSNGAAKFACAAHAQTGTLYHSIRFINDSDWRYIMLGEKALANKVYKISRAASVTQSDAIRPTITDYPENTIHDIGTTIQASNFEKPLSFTVSGFSRHYSISVSDYTTCTVKLRNLTAYYNNSGHFLSSTRDITIDIEGENVLICPSCDWAISNRWYGDIHVTGNGTLTIVNATQWKCGGIAGNNFYGSWLIDGLAADGTTIDVTDYTQNSDGTYIRTFHVSTE